MASHSVKIIFLHEILNAKNILFGSFDKIADARIQKKRCWNNIKDIMVANGVNKTAEELRDVMWCNIKSATIKKIDNRKKTGSEGGADCQLSDIDSLVLDIVGKTSATVVGLDVAESVIILEETTEAPVMCL